ncbi:MAG: hypothetical protein LBN25_04060, partial [Christensenellaceae bacterium]|nr:hypothetical protein [Christensenellaceae bacterium]
CGIIGATGYAGAELVRILSGHPNVTKLFLSSTSSEGKNLTEINPNFLNIVDAKLEDAETVIVAYGTVARIAKSAVNALRAQGIKAGLLRPITLYPFPEKALNDLGSKKNVKNFLTVELSMGQMVEDVRLAVNGQKPVEFYGRVGGNVMTDEDITEVVKKLGGKK